MTRRWSWRVVAGVLAGLLGCTVALAGCSAEQPGSDSLPTASAAPTEEALPPLGPPDLPMPAEARTPDAAGAEAFVRYYIELINRTSEVMDAAPLREFSDGCQECARISDDAERDATSGYKYEGGQVDVLEAGRPLVQGMTAEIPFRVAIAPLVVVDKAGQPVPDLSFPEYGNLLSSAALRWDSSNRSWLMTQLDFG